jgi:hypothetical protein
VGYGGTPWIRIHSLPQAGEAPRRQVVRQIIDGVDDQEVVRDRMVANGEIAEHQRGEVLFVQRVIVAPIWDMKPDGSAMLVGRRNVHTGEVEKVEGWEE